MPPALSIRINGMESTMAHAAGDQAHRRLQSQLPVLVQLLLIVFFLRLQHRFIARRHLRTIAGVADALD